MGKQARLANEEKMKAGILQVRVGPKERARDRKLREKQGGIFLPVPKGSTPFTVTESQALFGQAREIKNEVREGKRANVAVDLQEELDRKNIPEAQPVFLEALVDAATHIVRARIFPRHDAGGGSE
jgi:hypothetical protein